MSPEWQSYLWWRITVRENVSITNRFVVKYLRGEISTTFKWFNKQKGKIKAKRKNKRGKYYSLEKNEKERIKKKK